MDIFTKPDPGEQMSSMSIQELNVSYCLKITMFDIQFWKFDSAQCVF